LLTHITSDRDIDRDIGQFLLFCNNYVHTGILYRVVYWSNMANFYIPPAFKARV